jgi:hypothetical protein
MNLAIYVTQIAVVFLVPAAFGWAVLRRIVGEMDLAVLLPGAVVGGLVSLAALVNELRFGLEMSTALWSAYQLLVAGTLLILIVGPRARGRAGWRGGPGRAWRMALVLGAAALVAVYFGIPAFRSYLDDAWWAHYPIGIQVQTAERFPLSRPFAPDVMLLYHIGPDIIAASLAFLLHLPIEKGFALLIVVFAPATFLLAFGLAQRLSRGFWPGFLAACFVVLGGNLRFLGLLAHWPRDAAHGLEAFNSQTIQGMLQAMFTPSHCVGVPLVLLSLAILRHFVARPSWGLAVLLGVLVGCISLAAEWYAYPLWGAMAAGLALQGWRMRAPSRPAFLGRAGLLLLVGLAVPFFNNSYAAGLFQEYWLPTPNYASSMAARLEMARLDRPAGVDAGDKAAPGARPLPSDTPIPVPSAAGAFIIPVRLNLHHFGEVPSWEAAGTDAGTWIPILGARFLAELLPIIGVGLPFGWWWWRRSRGVVLFVAVLLASLCRFSWTGGSARPTSCASSRAPPRSRRSPPASLLEHSWCPPAAGGAGLARPSRPAALRAPRALASSGFYRERWTWPGRPARPGCPSHRWQTGRTPCPSLRYPPGNATRRFMTWQGSWTGSSSPWPMGGTARS